jgi:hypothetical protein
LRQGGRTDDERAERGNGGEAEYWAFKKAGHHNVTPFPNDTREARIPRGG